MVDVSTAVPALAAVLQGPPMRPPGVDPAFGLLGSALGAAVTTLVVGAVMVTVAPAYTERKMAYLREEPVGSFLYGLASLVFLVLVTLVLAITIIGIVVAVPLVLVSVLAWAAGAAIAYLTIAERLLGREDGWLTPLLLAAGMNGALTLTGIGGLVAFCIGAAGFGAVLRDYLE